MSTDLNVRRDGIGRGRPDDRHMDATGHGEG
jgi:hypothetical protein